ncbi:relaxase/mobilization nuclease domain-containing protein [Hyphomonas jannaschiana]|uniref:MobA/VirD2-like nuclease domain-containing protein n=1 Tax=Hyphomonas jannaschiana VP2 TaxID=1280952 RepID=A0A059FGW7_9PROT|nr:relaxase/mobilization nuclease domain-containing protein [Hyphomonas jannaschiana]KCZ89743.1 hypothetical protein HJA_05812 [Hyphomonas jannaschiana VP2]
MILVGNQRGGARDLARHLLKDENDHVHVHEVRGFASDDLDEAFQEAYALSRGTRCKQFLFSMSFNPPPQKEVTVEMFEAAIEQAEERLGLTGQPRAIVFHEKEGRRHAHAVWSRIDAENLKAVQLSFSKRKMQELSRDLYLEHGWQMPRGLVNSRERDPRSFTLEEWQQAKRVERDPKDIKAAIQDAWAISDSAASLGHALQERGFKLARGDRRGFVVTDYRGEVYSLSRWAGIKPKQIRDRVGDAQELPSLEQAKRDTAREMQGKLSQFQQELDARAAQAKAEHQRQKQILIERQRAERAAAFERIAQREAIEARERQARFSAGLRGLWDKLRGEHARIREENERRAYECFKRDRAERDTLVFRQLEQRRLLEQRARHRQEHIAERQQELRQDALRYRETTEPSREDRREAFKQRRREERGKEPGRDRPRGPER